MSRPPGMAAPAIPNLLSLRGTSGGGRGRGRNRGSGRGGHSNAASSQAQHDATIQGTDTDAAMSRLSAVQLGYLDDPFAPYFVQGQGISRRLPLINRGRLHSYLPAVVERSRRANGAQAHTRERKLWMLSLMRFWVVRMNGMKPHRRGRSFHSELAQTHAAFVFFHKRIVNVP